jgi:hypothetical protein
MFTKHWLCLDHLGLNGGEVAFLELLDCLQSAWVYSLAMVHQHHCHHFIHQVFTCVVLFIHLGQLLTQVLEVVTSHLRHT